MDIRDMKYFYTIAEEGNISKASRRLNIAQPPLSKQMKQLESELGAQLFERGSRRIRLTRAGEVLYHRAEQIMTMVDSTVTEIEELGKGLTGSLLLGTITTSGVTVLPPLIFEFHKLYPAVTYQLWEGDGSRVFELLTQRIIEIGIVRAPFDDALYEAQPLPEEAMYIAMNKQRICCGAAPDEVRLAELSGQPMIVPRRWRGMFSDWCRQAGFRANIICVCDGIVPDVFLTKMGLGMSVVTQSIKDMLDDDELVYKRIVDPAAVSLSAAVWMKGRSLSAVSLHFLELLKQTFCQNGGQNL